MGAVARTVRCECGQRIVFAGQNGSIVLKSRWLRMGGDKEDGKIACTKCGREVELRPLLLLFRRQLVDPKSIVHPPRKPA